MTPLSLTRKLLSFNTINPPGNERQCAQYCGSLLEKVGYSVKYFEFADKRTSLVARLDGTSSKTPICFTGHLDTIPLGAAEWNCDPFAGEVKGDKIYGRGAADMKAGVAAMILMAQRMAMESHLQASVTLVLTAGEEAACDGAHYLANLKDALGEAGALVVGEPTSNYPIIGHKGCMRLELTTRGRTAHAAMPELGDNAIHKAARVIYQLQDYNFDTSPHPLLGSPTLNIGTISGGLNINSVPDKTTIGVDIRTVPGKDHTAILHSIQKTLGQEVEVKLMVEAISIATDSEHEWIQNTFDIMTQYLSKRPEPRAVSYFTDASALTPAFGYPPTIILGPGEAAMAHKTDEYCYITKIEEAADAYMDIALHWCK